MWFYSIAPYIGHLEGVACAEGQAHNVGSFTHDKAINAIDHHAHNHDAPLTVVVVNGEPWLGFREGENIHFIYRNRFAK